MINFKYSKIIIIIFNISAWITGLFLSWLLLSQLTFFYSTWYKLLNIETTISHYAPQNRFGKNDFHLTSFEERVNIFSHIVTSINEQGKGLDNINYHIVSNDSAGVNIKSLLTPAEIVHLQDVANIMSILKRSGMIAMVCLLFSTVFIVVKKYHLSSIALQLLWHIKIIAILIIALVLVGAKNVFYYLHEVLFPPNHQWFFYYEDSLMSTLMQAPNIFAPIAIMWLLLTWGCWYIITLAIGQLADKKNPTVSGFKQP